jgi:hypothetical protein
MGKSTASLLLGTGLNIVSGILQITVDSMPTIVAVLGYIVGVGLMILGIIGFVRKKKHEEGIDVIVQELESKKIRGLSMLEIFDALRDRFALGLSYPQVHGVLRDKLNKDAAWGIHSSDILATFTTLGLIHSPSINPDHSVWLDFKDIVPNYVYQLTDIGKLLAHRLMSQKLKIDKGDSQK